MKRQALVLFAHGARDPRWATPFERLKLMTQSQLPDAVVALAFLEIMPPSLPDVMPQLMQQGCEQVTIVPVFLGQGGHVSRDLPVIVERLQKEYPSVAFTIASAAGEDQQVLHAIAGYCAAALAAG